MGRHVSLALVLHNHQPVGNFGWVIARRLRARLRALIDALERHPTCASRSTTSGPLLDWLRRRRPEFLERVGRLVHAAGSSCSAAATTSRSSPRCPNAIGSASCVRMADDRSGSAGAGRAGRGSPSGSGSRRAGQPGRRGLRLDDPRRRPPAGAASVDESQLWGSYTTDDQGRRLAVFATEQGLRYRMPFGTVPDTIDYLRDARRPRTAGALGHDGRRRREVRRLARRPSSTAGARATGSTLLRGPRGERRLARARHAVSEWLDRERPDRAGVRPDRVVRRDGRVGAARRRRRSPSSAPSCEPSATAAPRSAGCGAASGATSRSSTARSTSSTSRCSGPRPRSTRWPPAAASRRSCERARIELFQGQSNDCYWHGVFGGIYITHMRLATFEHLIAAEDVVDAAAARGRKGGRRDRAGRYRPRRRRRDPGHAPGQVVVVDPAQGAGSAPGTSGPSATPSRSVLRRRPEAYHAQLLRPTLRWPLRGPAPPRQPRSIAPTAHHRSTVSSGPAKPALPGASITTPMSAGSASSISSRRARRRPSSRTSRPPS